MPVSEESSVTTASEEVRLVRSISPMNAASQIATQPENMTTLEQVQEETQEETQSETQSATQSETKEAAQAATQEEVQEEVAQDVNYPPHDMPSVLSPASTPYMPSPHDCSI
jgi:hypothetical protein